MGIVHRTKRLTAAKRMTTKQLVIVPSTFKSYSAADVLAAGGAEKFGQTIGIDAKNVKTLGHVRISRAEIDRLQEQLRLRK